MNTKTTPVTYQAPEICICRTSSEIGFAASGDSALYDTPDSSGEYKFYGYEKI